MESTESNREGVAVQQRQLPPIKREPELSTLGVKEGLFLLAGLREKRNRTEWKKITKIIRPSWGPLTVNSLSEYVKQGTAS